MSMTTHVVRAGESLSAIAKRYGIADWHQIYDHPKNAEFRRKRPNPSLIYPGDAIFVPTGSSAAKVQPIESKSKPAIPMMPGDVAVRAGTFSGKNPLPVMIGEPYNHAGVAVDPFSIHHVESNGYETIKATQFFDHSNANGGAILRFVGPNAELIRARVAQIANTGRYPKLPGNPFSTSDNQKTVNCNEFVHELYRRAIAEIIVEVKLQNPKLFADLIKEYGDPRYAGVTKALILSKKVEFTTATLLTGLAVSGIELAAQTGVNSNVAKRGEVKPKFEGEIVIRNHYPKEWGESWNPFKLEAYKDGFYSVAVLRTYTPNSFVKSKYFSRVHVVESLRR